MIIVRKGILMWGLAVLVAAPVMAQVAEPPDPDAADVEQLLKRTQWNSRVHSASMLLAGGKTNQALAELQAVMRDLPGLDTNGMVAVTIGDCYLQLGRYDEAGTQYAAAAKAHPALADSLWLRLVQVDLAQGKTEQAEGRLQRRLGQEMKPEARGWALLHLGMVNERRAIAYLEQAGQAYRRGVDTLGEYWVASECRTDPHPHVADLTDAAAQLRLGLRDIERVLLGTFLVWYDKQDGEPARIELTDATITGQVTGRNASGQEITMSLRDGEIPTVMIDGIAMPLDADTQRQVNKHLKHILRICGSTTESGE